MVSCVLLAVAAVVWPVRGGRIGPHRSVRRAAERQEGRMTSAHPRWRGALFTAACAVGWSSVVVGAAGGLATAAILATGLVLVRQAVADRRRHTALVDLLAGLRMLGRELRSGAEPATAAENAGSAARGDGAVVLGALAKLARADDRAAGAHPGQLSGVVADGSDDAPRVRVQARLHSGWVLTRRHGLAFTPLIEALAVDLSEQLAAESERSGQVAGPRTSGYVMALLPLVGLALGAGMGADPIRVLLTTPLGTVLLLVGVSLNCGGLLWSARIVRR